MSYEIVFAIPGRTQPVDGDEVASNSGWAAFGKWVAVLGDDYPELAYLAEHGEVFTGEGEDGDAIQSLQDELRRALNDKPGDPPREILGVAQRLLMALRSRPRGAFWVGVTDGTEA